jgi:hypothetical protein
MYLPNDGYPNDAAVDNAMAWLDNYCPQNPFASMQDGLLILNKTLVRRGH